MNAVDWGRKRLVDLVVSMSSRLRGFPVADVRRVDDSHVITANGFAIVDVAKVTRRRALQVELADRGVVAPQRPAGSRKKRSRERKLDPLGPKVVTRASRAWLYRRPVMRRLAFQQRIVGNR